MHLTPHLIHSSVNIKFAATICQGATFDDASDMTQKSYVTNLPPGSKNLCAREGNNIALFAPQVALMILKICNYFRSTVKLFDNGNIQRMVHQEVAESGHGPPVLIVDLILIFGPF